jgi:polyhydroxybutyrate depolymerase
MNTPTILSAAVLGLVLAGCAVAAPPATQADLAQKIKVGNLDRSYLLHLPKGYDSNKKVPLLIALHGNKGTGERMKQLTLDAFNGLADSEGFIVAYPDGIEKSWNDGRTVTPAGAKNIPDVEFISKLIDALAEQHGVDRSRVFVTGMSNGAMFTHRLACELSSKIAGFAPVAGTMPEVVQANCATPKPVSFVIIHGTEDRFAPYRGGPTRKGGGGVVLSAPDTAKFWAAKAGCGSAPTTTQLPDVASDDGTRVTKIEYGGCGGGSNVVFYSVEGAGHTWPGGWQYLPPVLVGKTSKDLNAAKTIWEFFKGLPSGASAVK